MGTSKPGQQEEQKKSNESFASKAGWIDKQDIMQGLHISERTLQQLRSTGRLPFYRVGGKIYYDSGEVNDMIKAARCVGVDKDGNRQQDDKRTK